MILDAEFIEQEVELEAQFNEHESGLDADFGVLKVVNEGITDIYVKTVNGIEPDEHGNVQIQAGGITDEQAAQIEANKNDISKIKEELSEEISEPLEMNHNGINGVEYVSFSVDQESELGFKLHAGVDAGNDAYAFFVDKNPSSPSGCVRLVGLADGTGDTDAVTVGQWLESLITADDIDEQIDAKLEDFGGIAVETDPTVPSWAKQPNKPTYTASEVGALPASTVIPTVPTKVSAFENDKGYLTEYTETDPTVPAWAKNATKPSYSKSEVGLGNVDNVKQYSASNPPPYPVTSVNGKTGAVTLDAAAVGARPSTWMPSASDVGALPASTTIPTKVSQLTNDKGYLTEHQDLSAYAKKTDIPTNDQINSLIDAKLGVIENGTY